MKSEYLQLQLDSIETALKDNGATIPPSYTQRQMDILKINFPEIAPDIEELRNKYLNHSFQSTAAKSGGVPGEKIDVGKLGKDGYNPLKKSVKIDKNEPDKNKDVTENLQAAFSATTADELSKAFNDDTDALRIFINEKTGKSIVTTKILNLWQHWGENLDALKK